MDTVREHLQIVTNRKRSLYIEMVNDEIAVLTIETTIIYTTVKHHYNGTLKCPNKIKNRSRNLGYVSRYCFTNLVKLIHVKDIPKIINDFQTGKSLDQITYSSWPLINVSMTYKPESCDRLIKSLFQIKSSFYMSAYKTSTLTYRIIKSIGNMIGF